MSFNYVGQAPLEGDTGERYFYALRRDDDGQLFIAKVDKASPTDVIQINRPGGTDGNYTDFQAGESFFEGRNPNHVLVLTTWCLNKCVGTIKTFIIILTMKVKLF